jgi:hypothetical protein
MTQPDLFGGQPAQYSTGHRLNLPEICRSAAHEKVKTHAGIMRLVEAAFEIRPDGATADAIAVSLSCVLNTARRCAHYLAKEGTLLAIGIGDSAYKNPQTTYVHKKHAWKHQAAIAKYKQAHAAPEGESK